MKIKAFNCGAVTTRHVSIHKPALACALALAVLAGAGAQEWDPFGSAGAEDAGTGENGETLAVSGSDEQGGAGDFGFGFGDGSEGSPLPAASQSLAIGGELRFTANQFLGTVDGAETLSESASLANSGGTLRFEASGKDVDANLTLALDPTVLSSDPSAVLDEAWVRLWIDGAMLEGGIMKLTWGKADSLRVLDVANPLDLSDLTVSDPKDQKISRPMLHLSLPVAGATLEGVWIPVYEGNRVAWDGRWAPRQIRALKATGLDLLYYGTDPSANGGTGNGLYANYYASAWATAYASALSQYTALIGMAPDIDSMEDASAAAAAQADLAVAANSALISAQAMADAEERLPGLVEYPAGDTLDWSQFGARLTGTIGQVDLGLQYFWGFLPNPVIDADAAMSGSASSAMADYNRYHQVGGDLAAVIFGLNARFEAAANLTDDFAGDDPLTYNPALVWAAGFDRDLFSGINLNLQAKGSYVLGYGEIDRDADSTDIESGADRTATMIAARLAQKVARDTVEWELAGVWSPEDADFALAPSLTFAIGEAELRLAGRWFGGDDEGNLGQYADNSYAELSLRYSF